MGKIKVIDHKNLSLDEWLSYVTIPQHKRNFRILDCQFATDEHLDEYVRTIHKRSEDDVKYLLSLFLIDGGHLGHDRFLRKWLFSLSPEEFARATSSHSFLQRLVHMGGGSPPWPSITWIIDLLPSFPQQALDALASYFQAHCQYFPDGRIHGISDAETVIRARYMYHFLPVRQKLLDITSRDFELLVGYLYRLKKYDVTITPRAKDGGYDVLAEKNSGREQERLHIECKRYEQNIGVPIVRQILGTLNVCNATKAVLVTSSKFTAPAVEEAHLSKRVELFDVDEFDLDMRKFVDFNWVHKIPSYLMEMKKHYNNVLQRTSR